MIDQHFGHCSDFRIAEVDGDSGEWKIVKHRRTEPACRDFSHQEEHVKKVVELLSDCRYLLTYRIGSYPYSLFRSRRIECLETPKEEPAPLERALKNLKKYLAVQQAISGGSSDCGTDTERKEFLIE